jgi:hypothetical protein
MQSKTHVLLGNGREGLLKSEQLVSIHHTVTTSSANLGKQAEQDCQTKKEERTCAAMTLQPRRLR